MSTRPIATLAACLAIVVGTMLPPGTTRADSGKDSPSVDDIVNSLKNSDDDAVAGVKTRSLRPGAAAQATAAAAPAAPRSISMQIKFDFGSDRIAGQSKAMVDTLGAALASPELQDQTFQIVGHTDGKGSAAYNLALSQRRAASVKAYLVSKGVDASRLKASGKGMSELVNKDDPAAAENRRVEIIAGG